MTDTKLEVPDVTSDASNMVHLAAMLADYVARVDPHVDQEGKAVVGSLYAIQDALGHYSGVVRRAFDL